MAPPKPAAPKSTWPSSATSTFFHTGIPALLNVVYNQSPVVTIIMDNRITGMTGHQDNPGTGRTLRAARPRKSRSSPWCGPWASSTSRRWLPLTSTQIETTLKEYLKLDEPSVLITREPCALLPEGQESWLPLEVIAEKCNGCTLCFRVGCPAILKSSELDAHYQRPKALIDANHVHRLRSLRPGLPARCHHFRQDSFAD